MKERERERDREIEKEREREIKHWQWEGGRVREKEIETQKENERKKERQTKTEREIKKERQSNINRQRKNIKINFFSKNFTSLDYRLVVEAELTYRNPGIHILEHGWDDKLLFNLLNVLPWGPDVSQEHWFALRIGALNERGGRERKKKLIVLSKLWLKITQFSLTFVRILMLVESELRRPIEQLIWHDVVLMSRNLMKKWFGFLKWF